MRESALATPETDARSHRSTASPERLLREEILSFEGSALPASAMTVGFRGQEAISSPYAFDVVFTAATSEGFSLEQAVGSRASIVFRGEGEPTRFHGVIAQIEWVDAQSSRAVYRAKLVPELWHLQHSIHSRIFTQVSIPEIVAAVLTNAGLPVGAFDMRLRESHPVMEHVCQYRESDLAFISRLMEKVGLYYFFDHGEDREKLVITDHTEAHGAFTLPDARYVGFSHDGAEGPRPAGVDSWTCRVSAVPASVRLVDYDPLRPQIQLQGDASVSGGRGAVVLYGENLADPTYGRHLARVRAEELRAAETVFQGTATFAPMRSGYRVDLLEHPNPELSRSYLVVGVEHQGLSGGSGDIASRHLGADGHDAYRTTVRAVPDDVSYRAPRVTPWPRIDGVVDGVVDGAADSQYAQIDEHGRYRVRVFFDESDWVDGSRSTWVRMLQPHGGGVEGMHFPLRKGTEVHMLFLGGDPDRPVIVGTAPNARTPSKVTAANGTQNVLRSGANNQLVMEDAAGGAHVLLSSPSQSSFLHLGAGGSNFVASTSGHSLHNTGGDHVGTISGSANETVGGPVTQSYGATHDLTVAGASSETIGGTLDQVVSGAVTQSFAATHDLSVGAAASHQYGATLDVGVAAAFTQTVGASSDVQIGASSSLQVGADSATTIGGSMTLTTGGATTEHHGASKTTTIGGAHTLSAAGPQLLEGLGSQTVHGATQQIVSDGPQVLSSATHTVTTGVSTTQAGVIALEAGGAATINAAEVAVQSGSMGVTTGPFGVNAADVTIDAGAVYVSGGGIVEISAGVIRLN